MKVVEELRHCTCSDSTSPNPRKRGGR